MQAMELRANVRTITGKKVKTLRQEGFVPGVVYGHGIGSVPVQFDRHEIEAALGQAGTSTTVQVVIKDHDKPYTAIFRDVQIDPIRRNMVHVDLQALNLEETVRVPVSVILKGESPVIELGGMILQLLNEVEIEALPMALIPAIEVDITSLKEIGDAIAVNELDVPEGVTIISAPDEIVVQASYIEEEAEEDLEGAPELGEVEVIGEEPEEDMEGDVVTEPEVK